MYVRTYYTIVNLSTFFLSAILEVKMTTTRNQSLELIGKHLKSPCNQSEVLYKQASYKLYCMIWILTRFYNWLKACIYVVTPLH